MRKLLLLIIFMVLVTVLVHEVVLGQIVEPKLNRILTEMFGMPVKIQELKINLLTGHVHSSRVKFSNQPEFSDRDHLDVRNLDFDINFWALRDKRVEIGTIFLNRPYYLIERIKTDVSPKNNVTTWFNHIKEWKRLRKLRQTGEDQDKRKWHVLINRIVIHNGTFVFQDTSGGEEKKLVFHHFDGYLNGFEWPTVSPNILDQDVLFHGLFGEREYAPFHIEGKANFATSEVSFRLGGEITGGDLAEQESFWEGLPVQVLDGKFDLVVRAICIRKDFNSHNILTLNQLEVMPGPKAVDKFWGIPMTVLIGFLQDQKTIRLKVPVHGDISDPTFELPKAFQEAFQRALKNRSQSGIKFFVDGTAKLANQAKAALVDTPVSIAEKLRGTNGRKNGEEESSDEAAAEP